MKVIPEYRPYDKTWVLIPTLIVFQRGSEGPYTDITLAWICFGLTLRFAEGEK